LQFCICTSIYLCNFKEIILIEKIYKGIYISFHFFFLKSFSQVHPCFQFILICEDTCVLLSSYGLLSFSNFFSANLSGTRVLVSLGPRLHDVKPSGSASSLLSICAKKSRGPAWCGDATRQNGRLSHARRNKSLTMKNHFEEMGRNFCSLRFINGGIRTDDRTDKSVNFRHRYRELRI